jgi:ethanolamine transporter EutH
MINPLYIECYIACLIGNVIHLAIAYLNRSKDFRSANESLSMGQFLKMETPSIIADFVASMGLVYLADEWIDSDFVVGKIKTLFVFIGFTGSYVILLLASRSKAKLQSIVDKKSNVADYGTETKPLDK